MPRRDDRRLAAALAEVARLGTPELALALAQALDPARDGVVLGLGRALGAACAARLRGGDGRIVAVVADCAVASGAFFEALNNAGGRGVDLLVVIEGLLRGDTEAHHGVSARSIRSMLENFGFTWRGRIDAEDPAALGALATIAAGARSVVSVARRLPPPAVPIGARGRRASCHATGGGFASAAGSASDPLDAWACARAARDSRIVVVPASHSGLARFAAAYPDRLFAARGRAQHAVTFAAALACEGLRPIVLIDGVALPRAYDQLIHDVCLQRLPVIFALDGSARGAADACARGAFDLAYLRCVPGLVLLSPCDTAELGDMLDAALSFPGPSVVCNVAVPRPARDAWRSAQTKESAWPRGVSPADFASGSAQLRRRGARVAILAFGPVLARALDAGQTLDATVANMRFVKPLDDALVARLAAEHELVVTLEEHAVPGGAGSAVVESVARSGVAATIARIGVRDLGFGDGAGPRVQAGSAAARGAQALVAAIEARLDLARAAAAGGEAASSCEPRPAEQSA